MNTQNAPLVGQMTKTELLDAFDEKLDTKLAEFGEIVGMTFKRFGDSIDKRFDQVDKRFDAVDKRFEQVDKRFEQVDKRFDAIDKRFDRMDVRFNTLEFKHNLRLDRAEDRLNVVKKVLEKDLKTKIAWT